MASITPDGKDWTWVLDRPCPECGLDTRELRAEDLADLLREHAATWPAVLARPDARRRPSPQVWSPLEYACHVRDVFALYDQRLHLMRIEDDPLYPNWDQDATAVERRYGEQDPAVVAEELAAAAGSLARHLDEVTGEQWARPGRRSDGARFTIASFSRYLLHDSAHHLADVTRQVASPGRAAPISAPIRPQDRGPDPELLLRAPVRRTRAWLR